MADRTLEPLKGFASEATIPWRHSRSTDRKAAFTGPMAMSAGGATPFARPMRSRSSSPFPSGNP
jgi:hypothetical protein